LNMESYEAQGWVMTTFAKGDRVKIRDGALATMVGVVKAVTQPKTSGDNPKVEVVVEVFGRPFEIHFDTWHLEKA